MCNLGSLSESSSKFISQDVPSVLKKHHFVTTVENLSSVGWIRLPIPEGNNKSIEKYVGFLPVQIFICSDIKKWNHFYATL